MRDAPVLDLAPADFVIKEDGKDREVLKAEITSTPLQVMVLVDDNGSGLFRSGLLQFVQHPERRSTQRLVFHLLKPGA